MKQRPEIFSTTYNRPACFLERSGKIRASARLVIEKWLGWVSEKKGVNQFTYKNYIKIEVTAALQREEEVWSAICNSNHIWCQSYLDDQSGNLFLKMLIKSKENGIRDKLFFDLAMRIDTMRHIEEHKKQEIEDLMADLEKSNNIHFFFWHDIVHMMR